ncbi:MAG: hypothetical protein Q7T03_10965 [Deltaproteobacteria bacterium]|nr:hypothetical protein [Deltaproteobacteria bacterium]
MGTTPLDVNHDGCKDKVSWDWEYDQSAVAYWKPTDLKVEIATKVSAPDGTFVCEDVFVDVGELKTLEYWNKTFKVGDIVPKRTKKVDGSYITDEVDVPRKIVSFGVKPEEARANAYKVGDEGKFETTELLGRWWGIKVYMKLAPTTDTPNHNRSERELPPRQLLVSNEVFQDWPNSNVEPAR